MKAVFVLRHAKAEHPEFVTDINRPLAERGRMDAAEAGRELKRLGLYPEIAFCSSALRTRETLDSLMETMNHPLQIQYIPEFYYEGIDAYVEKILACSDSVESIMFVGHNPSISALAGLLDNQKRYLSLGTANLLYFKLDIEKWADLSAGELQHWFKP